MLGNLKQAEEAIKGVNPSAEVDLLRGRLHEARGQLDAAAALYAKAAAQQQTYVQAKIRLGALDFARGNLDDARSHLGSRVGPCTFRLGGRVFDGFASCSVWGPCRRRTRYCGTALALRPEAAELLAARGAMQLRRGQLAQALQSLRAAVSKRPADARMQADLGEAAQRAGRTKVAKRAYERALRQNPSSARALAGLAALALDEGAPDAARRYVERLTELGHESAALQARARLAVYAGGGAAAARELEELSAQSSDAVTWAALGQLYYQAEEDDQASQAFSRALQLDRTLSEARLGQAMVAVRRGQLGAAASLVESVERDANARGDAQLRARALVTKGRIRFEFGDFSKADSHAKQALAKDPKLAEAHLLLASIALQRGKRAMGSLERAVEASAPPPEAVGRLAVALKQGERACALARRYLDAAPNGYDAPDVKKVLKRCN